MMNNNTKCPNYIDHLENAIDRAFPVSFPRSSALLASYWAPIEADANEEYLNCEGH